MRIGAFDTFLCTPVLGAVLIGMLAGCDGTNAITVGQTTVLQVVTPSPDGAANQGKRSSAGLPARTLRPIGCRYSPIRR